MYYSDKNKQTWKKLEEVIQNNRTFTITTHVNPDGDAVGSELALYNFLRQRGKNVRIINGNPLPVVYNFLVDSPDLFGVFSEADEEWVAKCDVIFVLDISRLERLIWMESCIKSSTAYKVCIDHHEGNDCFTDLTIINESACATAELIYELIIILGGTIDRQTAEALYVAILTDTGSFTHSNVTERAHFIAAELIKHGVKPAEIFNKVYANSSWERVDLFMQTLSTLKKECGGKLAWMKITTDMFSAAGAVREEIEGFVDYPLNIAGVEMAILFLEVPDRGTKISLRAKNKIDVHKFAQQFGGGGHKHSAGIRLFDVDIDSAVTRILEKAQLLFTEPFGEADK
ncbi:hypothetical protein AMJ80_01145 [bacterium SM23_31]|nr:MAG: hypothetical protein AMJ80_01145 [bacterium SM23_31]